MIIVSNPRKLGVEFIGLVGLAAYSDVLQCSVSIQACERATCRAMKWQQKGCCHLSRRRQALRECWRELSSSLFLITYWKDTVKDQRRVAKSVAMLEVLIYERRL